MVFKTKRKCLSLVDYAENHQDTLALSISKNLLCAVSVVMN